MHWMAWEKMTETKEEGGLGFRDLETFNWLFWENSTGLEVNNQTKPSFVKGLKKQILLFQVPTKPRDSMLWKSWNEAKYLIKEG